VDLNVTFWSHATQDLTEPNPESLISVANYT